MLQDCNHPVSNVEGVCERLVEILFSIKPVTDNHTNIWIMLQDFHHFRYELCGISKVSIGENNIAHVWRQLSNPLIHCVAFPDAFLHRNVGTQFLSYLNGSIIAVSIYHY